MGKENAEKFEPPEGLPGKWREQYRNSKMALASVRPMDPTDEHNTKKILEALDSLAAACHELREVQAVALKTAQEREQQRERANLATAALRKFQRCSRHACPGCAQAVRSALEA